MMITMRLLFIPLFLVLTNGTVSAQFTNSPVTFGQQGASCVDLSFSTTDPTAAYGISTRYADFADVRDHVMDFGFNRGALTDSQKEQLYISFESRFNGNGGQWGEVNWEARYGPSGLVRRFQSFAIDWLTGQQIHQFNGAFSVADRTGTIGTFYVSDAGPVQITNGADLLFGVNNTSRVRQRAMSGGGYYTLVYLDNLDTINLGAANEGRPVKVNGPLQLSSAGLTVNGTKVIGNQCAAIPDSIGRADNTRAINAILACMRSHGLVSQ